MAKGGGSATNQGQAGGRQSAADVIATIGGDSLTPRQANAVGKEMRDSRAAEKIDSYRRTQRASSAAGQRLDRARQALNDWRWDQTNNTRARRVIRIVGLVNQGGAPLVGASYKD